MKFMSAHENLKISLKEKAIRKVGEHIAKTAISSISCRGGWLYEPELTHADDYRCTRQSNQY